ncbi:MAG: hypothetical protein SGJ09_06935 [Phycisphaerae bacterium]|nr:hypothetical protein [Phycisphaerae bacterium]
MQTSLLQVDPASGAVRRSVVMQFNPEKLSRSLHAQAGGEAKDGLSEPLRLRGPAVETIRFEGAIDLLSQVAPVDLALGIAPQLALLELLLEPSSDQLKNLETLSSRGILEITPMEAPLTVLVLGTSRVLPVRLTELTIEEEFFDAAMVPIRARVTIALRVLTVSDLGFEHRGSGIFLAALKRREQLAETVVGSDQPPSGIGPF